MPSGELTVMDTQDFALLVNVLDRTGMRLLAIGIQVEIDGQLHHLIRA